MSNIFLFYIVVVGHIIYIKIIIIWFLNGVVNGFVNLQTCILTVLQHQNMQVVNHVAKRKVKDIVFVRQASRYTNL